MHGSIYFSLKNLLKMFRKLDKSMKLQLKLYLLSRKNGFGGDTFIFGLIMQFFKRK